MTKTVHSERHQLFCELLIRARKTAGLTQAALAEKLGRPQSYVSKYENGERRLDVVEFLEVMRALGADIRAISRVLKRVNEA